MRGRLNASQTPVREAIRTLEQEGWLVSEFGKGTRVRELTPKAIDELFEMRELVEGFMARKAAILLTQDQIASLHVLASAADEMEQRNDEPGDEAGARSMIWHSILGWRPWLRMASSWSSISDFAIRVYCLWRSA